MSLLLFILAIYIVIGILEAKKFKEKILYASLLLIIILLYAIFPILRS